MSTLGEGVTTTNAAIPPCLSATRRHRAVAPYASSIHILRACRCPREHSIGGIARSSKSLAAFLSFELVLGRLYQDIDHVVLAIAPKYVPPPDSHLCSPSEPVAG